MDSLITSARDYLRLLLWPWKLVTFAMGTAFFVIGAGVFNVPTWDVGVSYWMSILCFALAPLGVLLVKKAWQMRRRAVGLYYGLLGAAIIYFVGSGSYEIYHLVVFGAHPPTYWPNLFFSVPVTIIAGILWSYDGSLRELLADVSGAVR